MSIITLTTDFGLADGYVASMKGVVLSINPDVRLVDISHQIGPQNIRQAAFILGTVHSFFPEGTVHVVVVDPGVGTNREAIIVKTELAYFIAPDNGVLSYVIRQAAPESTENQLGAGVEAIAITRPEYWRSPVSSTFHGRDIFAPVAARLSLGMPPREFGEPVSSVTLLPIPQLNKAPDGLLMGHIVHIDSFGNLITDITEEDLLDSSGSINIVVNNRVISGLSYTYEEGEGLLALIGSSGYLEVSLRRGSAADFLHAGVGDEVLIERYPRDR